MADVSIESLRLQLRNAAGHEHRMQGIAQRAAAIFGAQLGERLRGVSGGAGVWHLEALTAPALDLDLNRISDDEAAGKIADAWLSASMLHLQA